MLNLLEGDNWIEINPKGSNQNKYSELVAANDFVKDYEALYNTFMLDRSEFTQDPSNIGGTDCIATKVGFNKLVFKGKIDWYPEDISLGRKEGNRVGVQITPALSLDEFPNVVVKIGSKLYDKTIFSDGSNNSLWYYPLITKDSKRFTVEINWDGSNIEKFIIEIMPGTFIKPKSVNTPENP